MIRKKPSTVVSPSKRQSTGGEKAESGEEDVEVPDLPEEEAEEQKSDDKDEKDGDKTKGNGKKPDAKSKAKSKAKSAAKSKAKSKAKAKAKSKSSAKPKDESAEKPEAKKKAEDLRSKAEKWRKACKDEEEKGLVTTLSSNLARRCLSHIFFEHCHITSGHLFRSHFGLSNICWGNMFFLDRKFLSLALG